MRGRITHRSPGRGRGLKRVVRPAGSGGGTVESPLKVTSRAPVEVEPPLAPEEVAPPAGTGPADPDTDALTPSIIHDLREPLRSIRFVTGFLREDRPDMDQATARALGRVDDLSCRAD